MVSSNEQEEKLAVNFIPGNFSTEKFERKVVNISEPIPFETE